MNAPETIKINRIIVEDLPANWADFYQIPGTQRMGANWIKENLSAIVEGEINYLLNPSHTDFKIIRIILNPPFVFNKRIQEQKEM